MEVEMFYRGCDFVRVFFEFGVMGVIESGIKVFF